MRYFQLLWLLFCTTHILGQNHNIDALGQTNVSSTSIDQNLKDLGERNNTDDAQIIIDNDKGKLYQRMGLDSLALDYFDMVINHNSLPSEVSTRIEAAQAAAEIYTRNGRFDKAVEHISLALMLSDSIHDLNTHNHGVLQYGEILESFGRLEEAEKKYQQVFDFYTSVRRSVDEAHDDRHLLTYASLHLADINLHTDPAESRRYYENSKKNLNEINDIEFKKYLKLLTRLSFHFDDAKVAIERQNELIALVEKDVRLDAKVHSQNFIDKYRLEVGLKKKQIQIEFLKKQKDKLPLIYLIIGLVGVVFLTTVSLYVYLKSKKENNAILEARSIELAESNTQLKSRNTEMERFGFISSHDLKTPMLSIIGFSELLKEEVNMAGISEFDKPIDYILLSGRRMYGLVEDILEYSTLSQKIDQQPDEIIDLENLVNEVRIAMISVNRHKHTEIFFEGDVSKVRGNHNEINSIFQNLVGNGLHYNKSEVPRVKIKANQEDDQLVIQFEDNGIGIPSEHRKNIFRMFNRLHNQQEYSGTGLGLAIVKNIVNKLEGEITLEDSHFGGTIFRIELPKKIIVNTTKT